MSTMSDDEFKSIIAVLPMKRLLPDDQIKVRCERIFDELMLSAVAKASVLPFEDVKRSCRKFAKHARALRELLDPKSVQTCRLRFSLEMVPDSSGRVQAGYVADVLAGPLIQLDWIIELCERPIAIDQVPALWKFLRGRKNAPPFSALQRVVEELSTLFEEATGQVLKRSADSTFTEFARAFASLISVFQITDDMIDHELRRIIRKRKAKLRPSAVRLSDSTARRIAAKKRSDKPQRSK